MDATEERLPEALPLSVVLPYDALEGRGRRSLVIGMEHGSYCVACCWLLMLLLFVTGVMNLLWMGAITALVLIEKISLAGPWVTRMSGALLAGWGAWMFALVLFQK